MNTLILVLESVALMFALAFTASVVGSSYNGNTVNEGKVITMSFCWGLFYFLSNIGG